MRLSIFGLGYVGSVSLGCLARDGHEVIGIDIDEVKLDLIREGKSPVIEEGMPELIAATVNQGSVEVSNDVSVEIDNTDISFVCVGTPSLNNGDQNQNAILRLTEQLGEALRHKTERHILVYRSTLVPGTVENTLIPILESTSGKRNGINFDVCYQPEFLREGSSIKDYDNPPFTIIGATNPDAHSKLKELFGHLPCEYRETTISTAETMKYFCNIFHGEDHLRQRSGPTLRGHAGRPAPGNGPAVRRHPTQHLAGLFEAGLRLRGFMPAQRPAGNAIPGQKPRHHDSNAVSCVALKPGAS